MEKSRGVTIFSTAVIALGIYNLLGIGSYKQFSMLFQPLIAPVIVSMYIFTIFYGICGVYCGVKMLKLEDWARKMIVGLTLVSVVAGVLLTRTVMLNFKEFLLSEKAGIPPELIDSAYLYIIIFTAIITLFELSVIFFFTRPAVVQQFKSQ